MRTWSLILLISLVVLSSCDSQNQSIQVVGKVVEVEPVALDVILSIYDRSVVLLTHGISPQITQMFENSIKNIIDISQESKFNKTIFAVCDLAKDHSGKLQKFGGKQGVQVITPLTHYSLQLPQNEDQLPHFFNVQLPEFISLYTQSKPNIINKQDLKTSPYNDGYLLLVSCSNEEQTAKAELIHHKIFDYLQFFSLSFAINKEHAGGPRVDIFKNGEQYSEYASSAVAALFNFTTEPSKSQINDLVDYINVETISNVTFLEDSNYFRVFGSSIQYQILLVYRQKDAQNQEILRILTEYEKAAVTNRNDGLKYERVLFAVGTSQFLQDYFADEVLQKNQLYSIIITKTDYSSFQLRKYLYEDQQVTATKLVKFIEEVRLKKIDPHYKSEEIQANDGKKIRKIVGNNFYNEIFEQAEKSVMVLFFDSKDPSSSQSLRTALQAFVQTYYDAYEDRMNVGVFDLGKNQHKSLTISTSPELILFERSNKKKAKFFKGVETKESIRNWVNFEAKDFTIPENFGEPPIALGGSTNTQL